MEDGNEYVDFDNERPWVHYLYMFGLADRQKQNGVWVGWPWKQNVNMVGNPEKTGH